MAVTFVTIHSEAMNIILSIFNIVVCLVAHIVIVCVPTDMQNHSVGNTQPIRKQQAVD